MMFGGQWLAAGFQTDKPKVKYGFAPFPQVTTPATLYDSVGICTPQYTAERGRDLQGARVHQHQGVGRGPARLAGRSAGLHARRRTATSTRSPRPGRPPSSTRSRPTWPPRRRSASASPPSGRQQVGDLTTAEYQPILSGKKPITDLQAYVEQDQRPDQVRRLTRTTPERISAGVAPSPVVYGGRRSNADGYPFLLSAAGESAACQRERAKRSSGVGPPGGGGEAGGG